MTAITYCQYCQTAWTAAIAACSKPSASGPRFRAQRFWQFWKIPDVSGACLLFRGGLLGGLGFLPPSAPAGPGGLGGFLRLGGGLFRPLEDLLEVIVQGAALGFAALPGQGVAQVLAAGGFQDEGQVEAGLNRGPQVHLLEGVGVPGTQGVDGGGVALVLADDIGVVRLPAAHQHPQFCDDLEVDGVPAAPDALDVLHVRGGPGAQLLDFAEGQPFFLVKDQNGVLLGEHLDALQACADVVVAVH